MDWKFLRGSGRPGACRVPSNYFGDYFSPGYTPAPDDVWVTGRFSPYAENILFIGSDTGHVCVLDVEASPEDAFKYFYQAHPGVVMDLIPVPGRPDELLTMSGYDIRIWSMGVPVKSALYFGHDKSVRCGSFAPESPHVFSTGGRDGSIYMWDRRMAALVSANASYRRPVKEYRNCHLIRPPGAPLGAHTTVARRRSDRLLFASPAPPPGSAPPSITSMTYLDEHTLITASSSGKSGIRVWDLRKAPIRDESRPLTTLELPYTPRDAGISSICLDRFKSSLFAVSTDNCIYEFGVNSANPKPVRSYIGACIDADFYIQMACSPISDHILCGSGDKRALLWDAQKFHTYADARGVGPSNAAAMGNRPVLSLGGHDKKVANVGFSATAKYMLTMDDSEFRVWRHAPVSSRNLQTLEELTASAAFERAERLAPPREDEASRVLQCFSITTGPRLFLSPTKAGMEPLLKRKEPFASPFKKALPSGSSRFLFEEKENVPPGTKIARLDGVSGVEWLPSLEDSIREEEEKAREARRKAANPFYYKHPTMRLPNLVYERHLARLRGEDGKKPVTETETITKSGRKVRTLECWARSSAGRLTKESLASIDEQADAACSQMQPAVAAAASPRKLQLRPAPSAAAAAAAASAAAAALKGRRSSVRNILDYFQTNKKGGGGGGGGGAQE